jgi:hypothetical protein
VAATSLGRRWSPRWLAMLNEKTSREIDQFEDFDLAGIFAVII